MHPNRRRKKRPNYGLRTVEILRGSSGFGFTISGQQPCILSCIVAQSPADQAGLRAGDFLISVNGISVSKMAHDSVVSLIANCVGPIKMTIAENYYSDSSDEELECSRSAGRKPKYMHKPRHYRRLHKGIVVEPNQKNIAKLQDNIMKPCSSSNAESLNLSLVGEDEAGPIEYKALIGYLGTIEMPKQLLPSSRLQTVCSCIRKLRQEKRSPTIVLMTVLPTCLTLKNSSNHIIAIYPTNRVVYIGSTTDKGSRYFGLVTSAVTNDNHMSNETEDISNSCHVFVIDPKITDHRLHLDKAENFKISCTQDAVTGLCLEFPENALYIVNLIQTMYKLQEETLQQPQNNPMMANSPQPSASSNSDSGIGYRDDCGNISDRILVVEFPTYRPLPSITTNNRPHGFDGGDLPLNALIDSQILNNKSPYKPKIDLNNIRAYDNIKNNLGLLQKQPNNEEINSKPACRALPRFKYGDIDSGQIYAESPIDVPIADMSTVKEESVEEEKTGESNGIINIFRMPFEARKSKKKASGSCETMDNPYHKLSPKVYGVPKVNYSCEELNKNDLFEEKFCYGSLQDLSGWVEHQRKPKRSICAQSEPDVRIHRESLSLCDQNGGGGKGGTSNEGPSSWAASLEKLLEDPVGVHAFAEFLKKEFSAENIYFWTACERYRCLTSQAERCIEAQRIYKQHVGSGAPEAVNVDAQGVLAAEQGLSEARPDIFDIAQKQIFNLIKFDSYPRFLKSELYKRCSGGDVYTPAFDVRLALHNDVPQLATPQSKLKKSLSNAEDRRRKSLLPWHRKTSSSRSKSRERNETQKSWDGVLTVPEREEGRRLLSTSDIHSSHSSLTSLDLAASQVDNIRQEETRTALCRVLLTNGSTTVVQIKEGDTIQQLIDRLLEKRGLTYSSYEVYTNKHPKSLDSGESSGKLAGCEVTVEQRVIFKLDLPNKKIISVKSKYTKIIVDVLRPILHKYKFALEEVIVTRAGYPVDVRLPVTTIDNGRLNIQLKGDGGCAIEAVVPTIRVNKMEEMEITNRVFEDILQEKSEGEALKVLKSDKGSVKSEDWGSEHSGLLGKFLRRDSAVQDKKKKPGKEETLSENQPKKPLIAKLKAGANKLHVTACSENDELVEGLTRAQRRLEDQRGTEINFELPDFLKDKEERGLLKQSESHSLQAKVALTKSLRQDSHPNYENQTITAQSHKLSPEKGANKPVENLKKQVKSVLEGGSKSEPPPLPPKPKIVPMKPPNWGHQGGFCKTARDVPAEKLIKNETFLEQPSSSFV
ncbi:regulator of G-protein signaling loco isoform X1 [Euwallacea fornicatus]|uniref:regulator of G-protein signaling loco isoform X1 n=1 Tax=Euwallacea fornicatus TaxID=995702 RepID=UPI00338E28D8